MSGFNLHRIRHAGKTGFQLLGGMLGLGRTPLFLSWNITFRCNLRCSYCGASEVPRRELSGDEICAGLEEAYELGARWVTFGGGEPLLHGDIGQMIDHAAHLGYQVFLSTNGSLLPRKLDQIRKVDHINLSLDGPREVHDAVRGEGAFDATLEAAQLAEEAGISYSFLCTLGAHNLHAIDETVALAGEKGVWIMFQPGTLWLDSSTADNPVAAEPEAYRVAMKTLIDLKAGGAPIANSKAGLRHLSKWPDDRKIRCLAGRLAIILEPDGTMLSCHQCQVGGFLERKERPVQSLKDQFQRLALPKGCAQCWCAPVVELALIASFNPEAFWNSFRRFFKQ